MSFRFCYIHNSPSPNGGTSRKHARCVIWRICVTVFCPITLTFSVYLCCCLLSKCTAVSHAFMRCFPYIFVLMLSMYLCCYFQCICGCRFPCTCVDFYHAFFVSFPCRCVAVFHAFVLLFSTNLTANAFLKSHLNNDIDVSPDDIKGQIRCTTVGNKLFITNACTNFQSTRRVDKRVIYIFQKSNSSKWFFFFVNSTYRKRKIGKRKKK